MNDLLLRVARGEKVERPPVWLMRQAGRFLTEYKAVRARAGSFRQMIANPALAAEVTLQPVDLVGVDAAIIFSDILVVPEAMGLPYEMNEGEGPSFPKPVRTEDDLRRLRVADAEGNLRHTLDALSIVRRELNGRVPLIGFAGAPWTLFAYMTEGGGSKHFNHAKKMLLTQPVLSHKLIDMITQSTILYLREQVKAGAQIVQVFDSWAGMLTRAQFTEFALPAIGRIVDAIREVPVIVFARGASHSLDLIGQLPCAVVGVDWGTEPEFAAAQLPGKVLQGNLDPAILYADPAVVERETLEMLRRFPAGRHIANLGHGINPDTPRESVIAFVNTVKNFRYGSVN